MHKKKNHADNTEELINMAEIYIENEQDKYDFTPEMEKAAKDIINKVLEQENFTKECEVSLLITDDENIHMLNLEHRKKDAPTDVLSFPMLEFDDRGNIISEDENFGDTLLLGDIVISLERAYAQSKQYSHSPIREIGFLCAHSTLHLLGYDHEDSEESRKQMRTKEEKALSAIGLIR